MENSTGECENSGQMGRGWLLRPVSDAAVILPSTVEPTPRRRLWESASKCFHPDVLIRPVGDELVAETSACLRCVFEFFSPLLFSSRPADASKYCDPPAELFERVSWPEFCAQYIRLRNDVVPVILQDPRAAECFVVSGVVLKMPDASIIRRPVSDVVLKEPGDSPPFGEDFADESLFLGRLSCVGRRATLLSDEGDAPQVVVVQGFIKHVVEDRMVTYTGGVVAKVYNVGTHVSFVGVPLCVSHASSDSMRRSCTKCS